jgi:tetratricopeptide (TPR) repeat protein
VFAVAIGSEAGASVPDGGAPLRDAHDRVVTSRRSTSALEHLAAATDGALLMADRWGAVDTAALAAAVDRDISLESGIAPQGSMRRVLVPEARPFAALAFALLLLEALVAVGRRGHAAAGGATPRRWMPRALRATLPALLLCLVAAEAPTRPARQDPASTRSQLEHGFALARAGESARAAQAYSAAAVLSDDPALSALAHHNLGVLALQSDALERARDHFFEALVHAPNDHQMRFNAEWTLLALKARGREAPDGPPATEDTSQRPEQLDADEPGSDMPSMGEEESSAGEAGAEAEGEGAQSAANNSAAGGLGAAASGLATPSRPLLDESERARWLERVVDDPGKAMRLTSQARDDTGSPPRRGGATW